MSKKNKIDSIKTTVKTILVFSLLASTSTLAQEEASGGSSVTYDRAYFAPLKPVTLEDMIRNIPGGVTMLSGLRFSSMGRGFGSTGTQVLINGKRMSGKQMTCLKKSPAHKPPKLTILN